MARGGVGAWIRHALGGHGKDAASPRLGMQVQTSDGIGMGTITAIWRGADVTDGAPHEDTFGVQRSEQEQAALLYVPSSSIARVTEQSMILAVDEAQVTARGWRYRPSWLPKDGPLGTEAKPT